MHNKLGKSTVWAGRKAQNLLQIESWCQLSSSFRKAQDNGAELGPAWQTSWCWELGCPAWKGWRARHYPQSEVSFVSPVTTPPPTPLGPYSWWTRTQNPLRPHWEENKAKKESRGRAGREGEWEKLILNALSDKDCWNKPFFPFFFSFP